MIDAPPRRRLLLVVTEDWYFWSHRLGLARAARDAGWQVTLATRVGDRGEVIRAEGFRLVPLRMTRRQTNPVTELRAILHLAGLYRRERPDIIHHVALKPAVYGSLAARLAFAPRVVNMVAGLGHTFTGLSLKARFARAVLRTTVRLLFGGSGRRVIVQNRNDAAFFTDGGLVRADRVHRIPGSGVDCGHLVPLPEPAGTPVAALVGRMLWSKGVRASIEAARILKARGIPLRIALVGRPDPDNRDSVPQTVLEGWHAEGLIDYQGFVADIRQVWASAHIALLPTTYGEGIPKSLIEAAACGRPIVATDWPGCRDLVREGENGCLVPPNDAQALADALARLAKAPDARQAMGAAGRRIVEAEFTLEAVNAATLAVYDDLCPPSVASRHA